MGWIGLAGGQERLLLGVFQAPRPIYGVSPRPSSPWGPSRTSTGGGFQLFFPGPADGGRTGAAAHRRSELWPFSAPVSPKFIGKTLGLPQNAAGRVCARRVFCSAPQTETFFPQFPAPPWRMGIFGRAPSHPRQRGQPRGRGDGSSLAVAANIHGFSCQSPSPCRAAAPGSMKARVVRARAGAGRTQALCSVSPSPILQPQTLQLVVAVLGSIVSHYLGHPAP